MSRDLTDFTPFGYLRNPAHYARAWGDTYGGNLRTAIERLGVEWVYPVGRDASSRASMVVQTRACKSRADFAAVGLICHSHTCQLIGYRWRSDDVEVDVCFFLVDDNALAARVLARNTSLQDQRIDLEIRAEIDGNPSQQHVLVGETALDHDLAPGEERSLVAVLARGHAAAAALGQIESAFDRVRGEDAAFLSACPRLVGDWPAHWAEGLHHDFQTTRLLVQPSGGIFTDVWPSWMAAWPRVVFAEGTLDMLRLAYADAAVAQRAVLSLLRDAPDPNLPCVFRGGEYNMVAADGSRCGTSPAWCLPFLNLQLLYLRTLDREWLAQIYPHAAAYVEWWLTHRTDPEGWLVYKCTWESGEDGNPRLDPSGSGDADISGRLRPVELQATLAHAAGVLALFSAELGRDAQRWRDLEANYRARTAQLFDPIEGRFCDWLTAENRPQADCPDLPYWGVDACRYSAQSLTPGLIGLVLPEAEVFRHFTPPWTLWPSWTWSLVESAAAAGLYSAVGELAYNTIDRVYRVTTRRELSALRRPMPGSSPEFWPEDWSTYAGGDAYGWGATTANLLIRHLFGFKESLATDGWVADLTPAFPTEMLHPGAEYGIENLNYRGQRFDLTYSVLDQARLLATFDMPDGRREFETRPGERLMVRA